MARKSMYSSVSRARKNSAKTVAIVLAVVVFLLLGFIVWCAVMFSGDGAYGGMAHDVTIMKIQLEEKDVQINTLKEQITKLEEQKKQLEEATPSQEPTTTAPPTATPTPTVSPTKTPARTATPTPVATSQPTPASTSFEAGGNTAAPAEQD